MQTQNTEDLDKIFNTIVQAAVRAIYFKHNEVDVEEAEHQAKTELRALWKDDLKKNLQGDSWKVKGIINELTNTIEWQTWLKLEPYATEH